MSVRVDLSSITEHPGFHCSLLTSSQCRGPLQCVLVSNILARPDLCPYCWHGVMRGRPHKDSQPAFEGGDLKFQEGSKKRTRLFYEGMTPKRSISQGVPIPICRRFTRAVHQNYDFTGAILKNGCFTDKARWTRASKRCVATLYSGVPVWITSPNF